MNTTTSTENQLVLYPDDIVSIVFNSFLFLVGIPGNYLIIRVYAVKKNNSSARIFILGLAINDLLLCLIRPLHVFENLPLADAFVDSSVFYCKFRDQCELFLLFFSVLITVCIAVDRYFAVCHPFSRIITPQKAKYAFVICIILSSLVILPNFFNLGLVPREQFAISKSPYDCQITGSKELYYIQFGLYYLAIVGSQIVSTILCIKIVSVLRSQQLKVRPTLAPATESSPAAPNMPRPSASAFAIDSNEYTVDTERRLEGPHRSVAVSNNSQTSKVTRMLLLTTICFILFWIPAFVFYLIPVDLRAKTNFKDSPAMIAIVGFVGEDSYFLNIVINPLLYSLANKRFRDDSKAVIRNIICCDDIMETSNTTEVTQSNHN